MDNLLDQIYKTKLQLIAVLAAVGGIACLLLAHLSTTASGLDWLTALPISEIGSTLFSTGLLAVFFEYVDRKHGDQRTDERMREAVRREAPAIRDAVLDSFAFNVDTLKGIASDEALDRITTNALGLRLRDHDLARDAYTDLRDQVIQAPERWHDVDVSVTLSPWTAGPTSGRGSMFVATIRWEYRVIPTSSTMRFACVSDLDEYKELLRDQATSSGWYFGSSSGIDAASREAYELLRLSVDGHDRKIRRTQRAGSQLYTASLETSATGDESVTISYTYRVLVQRHGHLLYLDLPRPAKGLHVQLNYEGAGIRRVNTLDLIASSKPARIDRAPESSPARTIDIGFDGWLFPRSGVAFVWVLEDELSVPAKSASMATRSGRSRRDRAA